MLHSSIMLFARSSFIVTAAVLAVTAEAYALDAEREKELTHLVRHDCGSCHGMTLKGGLGRPLLPEALAGADAAAIAEIILDGVADKPMPGWRGLLTSEEAYWIASNLKKGFPQ